MVDCGRTILSIVLIESLSRTEKRSWLRRSQRNINLTAVPRSTDDQGDRTRNRRSASSSQGPCPVCSNLVSRTSRRCSAGHTFANSPSSKSDSTGVKPSSSNSRTPRNGDDSRDGLTRKQQKQLHVGSADGANSTDTIMIAHVPADGSNATLILIPRDSWVQIPGYGMGKSTLRMATGTATHLAHIRARRIARRPARTS